MELKVLAADKITAYHNYVRLHEELFSCVDPDACFETAKNLLENFRRNRRIFSEFTYYKEHGRILGKDPVFAERRKIAAYERMSTVSLFRRKELLQKSIWRLESGIRKGDRPQLDGRRQELCAFHRREILAIEALLKDRK